MRTEEHSRAAAVEAQLLLHWVSAAIAWAECNCTVSQILLCHCLCCLHPYGHMSWMEGWASIMSGQRVRHPLWMDGGLDKWKEGQISVTEGGKDRYPSWMDGYLQELISKAPWTTRQATTYPTWLGIPNCYRTKRL